MRLSDMAPTTTLAVFPRTNAFRAIAVIVGAEDSDRRRYLQWVARDVPVFTKATLVERLGPNATTDEAIAAVLASR